MDAAKQGRFLVGLWQRENMNRAQNLYKRTQLKLNSQARLFFFFIRLYLFAAAGKCFSTIHLR